MSQKADDELSIKEANRILNEFSTIEPPVNPLKIAKNKGYEVNFVKFSNPKFAHNVSGFFDPKLGNKGKIFVNSEETGERQLFTLAHELGHAILHRDWCQTEHYEVLRRTHSITNNDPKEQEANTFSANLLVPRHMLLQYINLLPLPELPQLFGVSKAMMGWRVFKEEQ